MFCLNSEFSVMQQCKLLTLLLWSFVVHKNNTVVGPRCEAFVTEGFDVFAKGRLVLSFEMCEAVLDAASQMDLISPSYDWMSVCCG